MDPSFSLPDKLRSGEMASVIRYLPTYEEANLPYSHRLPTYRSSYIRRYHPYARYTAPSTKAHSVEDYEDDINDDEPLDLGILLQPALPLPVMHELNDESVGDRLGTHGDPDEEGAHLVIVNPDLQGVIVDDNGDHQNDQGDLQDGDAMQRPHLYKVDMIQSFAALCCQ